MSFFDRLFGHTVMILILVFAVIHLGVSLGIIIPYRKYGDVFRPLVGLAGFNIVISFLGIVTGVLGLITTLMNNDRFGKVVANVSAVLGVFALASLVTAIVINAKSLNYISTHFSSNQNAYLTSTDARNNIDYLQNDFQCCGGDMWVDWSRVGLGGGTTAPNGTTVATNTSLTTSTTASISTTAISVTGTTQSGSKMLEINNIGASTNRRRRESPVLSDSSRQKRATPTTYGDIQGLPIEFTVTLPKSCCGSDALLTNTASDASCVSNANGVVNHFKTNGCVKPIDVTAGNQALSLAVINCFMIVLAFSAMPLLLESPSRSL